MPLAPPTLDTFSRTWTAQILAAPPMILPTRHFTYPQLVPGEEEALARGAMLLNVQPRAGGNFLATCSLGFKDRSLPTGVFACPARDEMLAVAGGYAYLVNTLTPDRALHIQLKPVVAIAAVSPSDEEPTGLLLLAGFHNVLALDANGIRWESARLTWEGLSMTDIAEGKLHGTGWNMMSNRDVPFTVDLKTGAHEGGGFQR
ncbi:hypothetical protein SAMN05421819_1606 [Bryocella elongata]|uniref:Uncharacterized protein n=1 Tax=Bryocella elongata TaxID=863522 RepID=A0A1H5WJS4_9BACT|nr:hypothetical protein [Bryocella elongata]SEF99540.1 hypothetical protein SAMN05421819_1606 [Bryocella elongata]